MQDSKISGVLFDLDGTLLNTAPDLAGALNTLLEQQNKPPLPLAQIRQVASLGSAGLLKLAFDIATDDPQYPRLRQAFLSLYEQSISVGTRPFEGIKELLEEPNQRKIQWGIVTNKAEYLARKVVKELGLMENCACLIGGDTTPFFKPAPEPLYEACQRIDLPVKDCVFIGDSHIDIQAAKNASMQSVAVLYGYHQTSETPESWGADHYIETPSELKDWLMNRV